MIWYVLHPFMNHYPDNLKYNVNASHSLLTHYSTQCEWFLLSSWPFIRVFPDVMYHQCGQFDQVESLYHVCYIYSKWDSIESTENRNCDGGKTLLSTAQCEEFLPVRPCWAVSDWYSVSISTLVLHGTLWHNVEDALTCVGSVLVHYETRIHGGGWHALGFPLNK